MRPNSDLHEYQRKAIMRVVNEKELALFLGLGLGKTAISLFGAKRKMYLGQVERCLIVTTLRAAYTVWPEEIAEWKYTSDLKYQILHGAEKGGRFRSKVHLHIINYEGLSWLSEQIRVHVGRHRVFPYQMLILDESTKLKSHKTQRFKKIKGLLKHFENRYLLTAGPAPNHLLDLWSQFYCLDQGKSLGTAYTRFQWDYFYQAGPYKWNPRPDTKERIKNRIKPKTLRLRARDYIDLPETIWNKIPIDLPSGLRTQYKELEEEFFLKMEEGEVEAFNAAALSMKLRQFVQGGIYLSTGHKEWTDVHDLKIDILKDIIDTVDTPLLVPIQFRFDLWKIRAKFGKNIPSISGGTDPNLTMQYCREWNEGKIPLLLCHPKSMAHALNLQKGPGHNILWYGLTWSLEEYEQLLGRIERQGQKNQVVVHLALINNTVDIAVHKALQDKSRSQESLLQSLQTYWAQKKVSA